MQQREKNITMHWGRYVHSANHVSQEAEIKQIHEHEKIYIVRSEPMQLLRDLWHVLRFLKQMQAMKIGSQLEPIVLQCAFDYRSPYRTDCLPASMVWQKCRIRFVHMAPAVLTLFLHLLCACQKPCAMTGHTCCKSVLLQAVC